jgi:hypothetical protein
MALNINHSAGDFGFMLSSNEGGNGVDDQTECSLIITEVYREGCSSKQVDHRVIGPVVDMLRTVRRHMPSVSGKRNRRPVPPRPNFRIEFANGLYISDIDVVAMVARLEADLIYPGWVSERIRTAPRSQTKFAG